MYRILYLNTYSNKLITVIVGTLFLSLYVIDFCQIYIFPNILNTIIIKLIKMISTLLKIYTYFVEKHTLYTVYVTDCAISINYNLQ